MTVSNHEGVCIKVVSPGSKMTLSIVFLVATQLKYPHIM